MGVHRPSGPASFSAACSPFVGQTFMHSPHLMHVARNLDSGREPGGRISFSEALELDMRKRGTVTIPRVEVRMSLRREKSIDFDSAGANLRGKVMADVGQMDAQ